MSEQRDLWEDRTDKAPAKCKILEMDLRPGGSFLTQISDDGGEFVPHVNGCFLAIDNLERIVFTNSLVSGWRPAEEPFMTAIITLKDHPMGTEYAAHVMHKNKADRNTHEKMGFYDGWGTVTKQLAANWLGKADALLFGRRTYDNFSRDWPNITDPDDPFTEKMNGLPKYVASHSLAKAEWAPTTILSGDIAAQVLRTKAAARSGVADPRQCPAGPVAAGRRADRRIGLVIAPVVVGNGRRLFPVGGAPAGSS